MAVSTLDGSPYTEQGRGDLGFAGWLEETASVALDGLTACFHQIVLLVANAPSHSSQEEEEEEKQQTSGLLADLVSETMSRLVASLLLRDSSAGDATQLTFPLHWMRRFSVAIQLLFYVASCLTPRLDTIDKGLVI